MANIKTENQEEKLVASKFTTLSVIDLNSTDLESL
jgi:hypothetical protein